MGHIGPITPMSTPSGNIDVILSPAEIDLLPQRELAGSVAVVFDVLRATSTMITALAHGAAGIWPVRGIEEAWALKDKRPAALLGGERHGDRIEGFDLGNSPLEYGENVRGREIITTTTLLNIGAAAVHLNAQPPGEILLVCAGTYREPALEDILAAGMLISLLPGRSLSDSAQLALALYCQEERDLPAALRRARNGRALLAKGREPEVEWCARPSVFPLLAEMNREGFVRVRAQP
jgi:2-phosphosulfolactate phosphatase